MQTRRFLPLLLLALGLALFLILDLGRYFDLAILRDQQAGLRRWIELHPVPAVAAYLVFYTLTVAFSLPVASLVTLAGGFLFGPWLGTLWTALGATLGATAIFLAARAALGDHLAAFLRHKAGPRLAALEHELRHNGFHYLLFLRLVPAFPFWLVNIAPAFFGIPLRTYIAATAIGILPGTFVFTYLGHGLDTTLEQSGSVGVAGLLSLEILIALTLLALLSLLPVWLKRRRRPGQE
ncbi:MAG: TVP38/TMEM64 family protein [Ferrovibrio sp.]|uniref:TVP38/TMEM64 family protein n=1 Tax=Ferrovibrio sp. TaxID=1917215 RepID=UPI00391AD323